MEAWRTQNRTWGIWLLDRFGITAVVLLLLYCLRGCWRTARANQKLALADTLDHTAAERRGLLLPIRDPRAY
jgi:uncharacterized membrane protein YqjE